jgi:hypothetical protein
VFSSQWTCDGKNSSEFERPMAVMYWYLLWMLGLEDGLFGTSPAVARGGGATDAAKRRGVVVVAT